MGFFNEKSPLEKATLFESLWLDLSHQKDALETVVDPKVTLR